MNGCDFCEGEGIFQDCDGEWWICDCDVYDAEHDWSDIDADADTLASVGWGTDEDYGYFGGDY